MEEKKNWTSFMETKMARLLEEFDFDSITIVDDGGNRKGIVKRGPGKKGVKGEIKVTCSSSKVI